MTKDQVIKLRNELKCGKNIPLRILINNSFTIIDESNNLQFTKWDDTNGILYSIRLVDMNIDNIPSNRENSVTVFAVSYDTIEAMEIPILQMKDIDDLFAYLGAGGCVFGDDFQKLIKNTFEQVMHPDRFRLNPSDIAQLLGPDSINAKDDYYNHPSKFVDSFKETVRYNKHNKDIIDSQNNTDDDLNP